MFLVKTVLLIVLIQELFLKWLSITNLQYQIIRQIPDIIIFYSFLYLYIKDRGFRKDLQRNTLTVLLILFLILGVAISFIRSSQADIFIELMNLKALLRYSCLIYIVSNCNPSRSDIASLFKLILFCGFIQLGVGFIQLAGGLGVRDMLAARHILEGFDQVIVDVKRNSLNNSNALVGTIGDNVGFAYFMLAIFCILVAQVKRVSLYFLFILSSVIAALYFSGSRAVVLVLPFLLLWKISHRGNKINLPKIVVFSVILLFPALFLFYVVGSMLSNSYDNTAFFAIFSGNYLEAAMNQRLGVVLLLMPELFSSPSTLIGYGPDKFSFGFYVQANFSSIPNILAAILPNVLEDIYWIALFVYYGPIGLILWCLILYQVFATSRLLVSKSNDRVVSSVGHVTSMLCLCAFALNFINPAFEIRIFSFLFWLFAGLTYSCHSRLR